MTTESPKSRAGSRFIDTFLQSPLAGLTPWIVMALLSGPGRFEESVSAALGLSILFIYLRHKRGGSLKPLELFEVAYFGTLAVSGSSPRTTSLYGWRSGPAKCRAWHWPLSCSGIAMLVTDNDPVWLAIALIVVGGFGGVALRRVDAQRRTSSNA